MGRLDSADSARSLAGVAAVGPIGRTASLVEVAVAVLDESSSPRTTSQITKAAATASAITAPIRTLDRRAQAGAGGSLTPGKNRQCFGERNPRRPGTLRPPRGYNPPTRAVSSVGRAPARQAGGHWFEPSTAHHLKAPQRHGAFVCRA